MVSTTNAPPSHVAEHDTAFDAEAIGSDLAVKGVEEDTASGERNGTGASGTEAAGTGRRRRRGGRGRNRRDRESDVPAGDTLEAEDGSSPIHAEADDATIGRTSDDVPQPTAHAERVDVESVGPVPEAPDAETADAAHGARSEADDATSPLPGESLQVASETTAPIVGETDAAAVMAEFPTEPESPGAASLEAPVQVATVEPQPTGREGASSGEPLVAQAMRASGPPVPAATPRAPVEAASVDLQGELSKAGLQLVNTDARKLESARAQSAQNAPVMRPARERQRIAPPPAEPLAQVETRKH